MLKKIFTAIALLFIARSALAITVLPGYEVAAIATADADSFSGAFTSNYKTPQFSIDDTSTATWVMSTDADAYIDLTFTAGIYDGEDTDISIFFVGGGSLGHTVDIAINGQTNAADTRTYSIFSNSETYTNFCIPDTAGQCGTSSTPILVMDIDLADFAFLGTNPVVDLRLGVGDASAVPSLVGGHYLEASAVVPLPLPVILFSSGLALLGLVGRKRK